MSTKFRENIGKVEGLKADTFYNFIFDSEKIQEISENAKRKYSNE